MTKAILVIDMPKSCFECKFGDTNRICEMCIVVDRQIHDEEGKLDELDIEKPLWCPLKPIPKTKEIGEFEEMDFLQASYELGRNSVIYEILGEEECTKQ